MTETAAPMGGSVCAALRSEHLARQQGATKICRLRGHRVLSRNGCYAKLVRLPCLLPGLNALCAHRAIGGHAMSQASRRRASVLVSASAPLDALTPDSIASRASSGSFRALNSNY